MKNSSLYKKSALVAMTLAAAAVCLPEKAAATYPKGYYDSLNGLYGVDLMRAVKAVVINHTEISYSSGTWEAFRDTDVRTINGVDYWWDMYSNELREVGSGKPDGMNVEHSVANSWWGGTKNAAYKDIVHLNPSDADANSRKSNYPLSTVGTETWTNGVTTVGKPVSGEGGGATYVYEPCDEYKGDFARVFMYIFTVYNDISWKTSGTNWMYDTSDELMFQSWAKKLLLAWHDGDPVSVKEEDRNDGVYKNQKNRNPFIDLPHLAAHIWGDKATTPFNVDESAVVDPEDPDDPTTDPDATAVKYQWLSESDSNMGDWTIENVEIPSESDYIWSWKTYNNLGYLNGSAYINGTAYASKAYAWSPVVDMSGVESATLTFSHAAKFQTTLKDLCGLVVKDVNSGEITDVAIGTWPSVGSWTFVDSGDIDLLPFAGKTIQVGLKYGSDSTGADTWEVRNMTLNLARSVSSLASFPDESDDSFLVELWGNNIIAPEGARIFDMNGREFGGKNLSKGIYIVVKPTFDRAVKVVVK